MQVNSIGHHRMHKLHQTINVETLIDHFLNGVFGKSNCIGGKRAINKTSNKSSNVIFKFIFIVHSYSIISIHLFIFSFPQSTVMTCVHMVKNRFILMMLLISPHFIPPLNYYSRLIQRTMI